MFDWEWRYDFWKIENEHEVFNMKNEKQSVFYKNKLSTGNITISNKETSGHIHTKHTYTKIEEKLFKIKWY